MKKHRILRYCVILGLILGVKNGCIALWENGTEVEVYPYRAELLPKADQQLLKKGIPIQSEAELAGILEDYLS